MTDHGSARDGPPVWYWFFFVASEPSDQLNMLDHTFLSTCRHAPYPNLYPDQSPSEEWTMEERFRPLTFHGLILRSQLVNLLIRGVCYAETQSVGSAASFT